MKVIFYTTGCPRCKVLKYKLDQKGIKYEEFIDVAQMLNMGINAVPMLQIEDGDLLDFSAAVKWIENQEASK